MQYILSVTKQLLQIQRYSFTIRICHMTIRLQMKRKRSVQDFPQNNFYPHSSNTLYQIYIVPRKDSGKYCNWCKLFFLIQTFFDQYQFIRIYIIPASGSLVSTLFLPFTTKFCHISKSSKQCNDHLSLLITLAVLDKWWCTCCVNPLSANRTVTNTCFNKVFNL